MEKAGFPLYSHKEIAVRIGGHENCEPLHCYGPAIRDYYLLHVVQSGRGMFQNSYGQFPVKAGQGFFIFPQEITVYTADKQNPWAYDWVGFSGNLAQKLMETIDVSQQQPVLDFGSYANDISQIIRDIYHHASTLYLREMAEFGGMLRLFAWLRQAQLKDHHSLSLAVSRSYYQKAKWYMDANLQKDLKITEVAAFVGLSRSQLFRIIVANSGMSPKQMLLLMRLKHAEILLKETDLPLKAIALSCGFSSAARMGVVFKSEKGITATQYRES